MATPTDDASVSSHWETIWSTREPTSLSWYQARLEPCLELVGRVTDPGGTVLVVGAGSSALVVQLARAGYRVTAIDVAPSAIDLLRRTIDDDLAVRTDVADVRRFVADEPFDTWHDRAVFHFLVEAADRSAYADAATAAVRPGGHLVIATFAPAGPDQCSGLDVMRHGAGSLAACFPGFEMIESFERDHVTPAGASQRFTHAVLRRR